MKSSLRSCSYRIDRASMVGTSKNKTTAAFSMRVLAWSARRVSSPLFEVALLVISVRRGRRGSVGAGFFRLLRFLLFPFSACRGALASLFRL